MSIATAALLIGRDRVHPILMKSIFMYFFPSEFASTDNDDNDPATVGDKVSGGIPFTSVKRRGSCMQCVFFGLRVSNWEMFSGQPVLGKITQNLLEGDEAEKMQRFLKFRVHQSSLGTIPSI